MTTLGIILIVLALAAMIVIKFKILKTDVGDEKKFFRIGSFTIILGVLMILIPFLFFYSKAGYQYFLVFPSGKKGAVVSEGIKWRGFAVITQWQKFIDIKAVGASDKIDTDEIEGVMSPVPLRFIDQVTGNGYVSIRFQLPTNKEDFINLAVEFRSMENLVMNTLIPTVKEVMIITGYMFRAQDYISGEAQAFRQALDEQLKDGTYAVKKTEIVDTIYDTFQAESRRIKEIKTTYRVDRIFENGLPKRIPHEITKNRIRASQVIVDKVDLEQAFKTRLEAQRDESAKRQLEQQKIETAKAAQQRIIAEGERDKAGERVTQEKEQVKQLIAIETKLKQERTNKDLAEIALKTERLKAEAKKVAADAMAYENRKLVEAGLTPQERVEWQYKTNVEVARELSKLKLPSVYISGQDGAKGQTLLESLIGAELAKSMMNSK